MRDLVSPLFLGLTRPARYAGLPVAYFAIWSGTSTLLFIYIETLWLAPFVGAGYVALRLLAERDPTWFEVIARIMQVTPPTRNRSIWGGDAYDA